MNPYHNLSFKEIMKLEKDRLKSVKKKENRMTDKELLDEYDKIIKRKAKSFNSNYTDDLIAIGKITVLKAYKDYDETKGAKFSTYVRNKISHAMKTELSKLGWFTQRDRKKNFEMCNLSDMKELADVSIEDTILKREMLVSFKDAIAELPEVHSEVIRLMYWNGMGLIEVASYLGLSEGRVSQLHKEALLVLKEKLKE